MRFLTLEGASLVLSLNTLTLDYCKMLVLSLLKNYHMLEVRIYQAVLFLSALSSVICQLNDLIEGEKYFVIICITI